MENIMKCNQKIVNIITSNKFIIYKFSKTDKILIGFDGYGEIYGSEKPIKIDLENKKLFFNVVYYLYSDNVFKRNKTTFEFKIDDLCSNPLKNFDEFVDNLIFINFEDADKLKSSIDNNDLVESLKIIDSYGK